MSYEIVTTSEQFKSIVTGWSGLIACDVETYGERWSKDGKLLGVSLSPEIGDVSVYIPFNVFAEGSWAIQSSVNAIPTQLLAVWIAQQQLVGHSFTYDKHWIDKQFEINSTWQADTRLMWHLASAPAGPRPYSLKDAMVEVLGWGNSNDGDLANEVKSKGGSLKNGDHYLASLGTIAHYATLDTHATMLLYKKLKPFFDKHEYWPMLQQMMAYNLLLEQNTFNGIMVDKQGLQKAHDRLLKTKEAAEKRFRKELKNELEELEGAWADRRIAEYKREYNKVRYANHPEEWKRFNLNSDKDKRELFFDKLQLQAINRTPSGLPSVDGDSLKRISSPYMDAYLKYEKANTLSTNFSGPYLKSIGSDSRLHPGFNICGTVSYRLSGFKPYLLNAPFDEVNLLRNLQCDEGWTGIHADLSAIEPTITAHYSEDPALLKVFRDGSGDIYLDLALELFPDDKELQNGYNPNIQISKEVKNRFERQRKIAKVIQLAVQYTGTGHTVSKNLSKDGISTTVAEADNYVRAYWRKFSKVREFNDKLREVNRKQGYLRNVIGRIIRVPDPDYKDLPNRFIQSSAHDILLLWVLKIYELCKERQIGIRPTLIDCHDSTSNQVPSTCVEAAKMVYQEALDTINRRLELCVTIKAEVKTFQTLAGLKNQE